MIKTGTVDTAPPVLDAPALPSPKVIDRRHLSEFAMGDRHLEARFLRLFTEHARTDLQRMSGANAQDFHRFAHSLKSSASSVGAWRVVEVTERALAMDESGIRTRGNEVLGELTDRVEEAIRHIRQILDND